MTPRDVEVTVRYFAAARAAAGVDAETLALPPGATVDQLVTTLSARGAKLGSVLARCSFLADGVAVRDKSMALQTSVTLDVLPPFAGG